MNGGGYMNKVRINEWAKSNNYKSADVMKKLLAAGYKVNRITEKLDEKILNDVVLYNKKKPSSKGSFRMTEAQKIAKRKKHKKNNYRTNLYNARTERGLFTLDDLFEKLNLEYQLSDEMKQAIGLNIKKEFKYKKGYNGSYLINLYDASQEKEITEFLNTLI